MSAPLNYTPAPNGQGPTGLVPYTAAPAISVTPTFAPELAFTERQVEIIKRQIAPDCNDDELALFLEVCRATGLNPLFRQIYAIVRSKDDPQKRAMTIQTGIDGYRLLAARTGGLAGIDDATFDVDPDESWHPGAAHVTVWRFVQGQRVPFSATARWSEYAQGYRSSKGEKAYTGMWAQGKMPYGQLAKCAEALALRKACPAELSGVYTGEEMAQADNPLPLPSGTYVEASATAEPTPARPQAPRPAPKPTPKPAPQTPAPWKALTDRDVLAHLHAMEITGRESEQAFLGTVRDEMAAVGATWTRDQVLAHLRENYPIPAGEDAGDTDGADLADVDTGAPGN